MSELYILTTSPAQYYSLIDYAITSAINFLRNELINIYNSCPAHSVACTICEKKFLQSAEKVQIINMTMDINIISYMLYFNVQACTFMYDTGGQYIMNNYMYGNLYNLYLNGLLHLFRQQYSIVQDSNTLYTLEKCSDNIPVQENKLEKKIVQEDSNIINKRLSEINELKTLYTFDYEKRKNEFEKERQELELDINNHINEKNRTKYENDKKNQQKKIFVEEKQTYYMIKKQLHAGEISSIPELFKEKYDAYSTLDKECILGMENEYEKFNELSNNIKIKQFINDKHKYNELHKKILSGEMTEMDIDLEFRSIYEVMNIVLSDDNMSDLQQYEMFIVLYAEYLESNGISKYNVHDINYLQDSSSGPIMRIESKLPQNDKQICDNPIIKAIS